MNSLKQLLLLGSAGLAALTLPSCVDPYVAHHPPSHTVYRTGYEVRTLPHGYRREVIGGTSYYVHGSTYYRPRGGRYIVVDAPRQRHYRERESSRGGGEYGRRDVVINSLPRGYRVVERGGTRYYQSGNVYYQRRGSGYIVVERPY